jgi:hypothetical protein
VANLLPIETEPIGSARIGPLGRRLALPRGESAGMSHERRDQVETHRRAERTADSTEGWPTRVGQ